MLSGALFGGYYYYNADNDQETEIRVAEADAGVIYEPSEVLRFGVGLGYADRQREETSRDGVRDEAEHETGPVVRADLRYMLPDFTVSGNVRWTTAAAEDNHFSGSLGGFYTLPRGTADRPGLPARRRRLDRRRGAGDRRDHRARARDQHGQPARARLRLGDPGQTSRTTTRRAGHHPHRLHRRATTTTSPPSVTAEVGYNYQTRDEDPIDADSHRVFLVIGRTFETGL